MKINAIRRFITPWVKSLLVIVISVSGYCFEFLVEWPFRMVMGLERLLNRYYGERGARSRGSTSKGV
ncbi:MAG: hypothetical protein WBG37_04420 [Desulfobacterales bacterium]